MKQYFVRSLASMYRLCLCLYTADFRTRFAGEMESVFQELVARQAHKGVWALFLVGFREFYQLPLALWQVHLAAWRKNRGGQTLFQFVSQSPFHPVPRASDGRFSWRQTFLELIPFIITAVCLFIFIYQRPAWLPTGWQRQWTGLGWFALLFTLPPFLLGLARGLPRWSYPVVGLPLGYSLLLAHGYRLVYFWSGTAVALFLLAVTAVYVHLHSQPLPPFWQRIGRSMALDWTRLAFGLYGLTPAVILLAFDTIYRLDRAPHLALSLLLMILGALAYSRSRHQRQQYGCLLAAVSAVMLPPLLYQPNSVGWVGGLWVFMISLLLLPPLARLFYQLWTVASKLPTARDGRPPQHAGE
jgi:hypothetical protein